MIYIKLCFLMTKYKLEKVMQYYFEIEIFFFIISDSKIGNCSYFCKTCTRIVSLINENFSYRNLLFLIKINQNKCTLFIRKRRVI